MPVQMHVRATRHCSARVSSFARWATTSCPSTCASPWAPSNRTIVSSARGKLDSLSLRMSDAKNSVPIVTIDGPSSSGKGTISRLVAARVGWHLLDSGALYRLVALAGIRKHLDPDDVENHVALAR